MLVWKLVARLTLHLADYVWDNSVEVVWIQGVVHLSLLYIFLMDHLQLLFSKIKKINWVNFQHFITRMLPLLPSNVFMIPCLCCTPVTLQCTGLLNVQTYDHRLWVLASKAIIDSQRQSEQQLGRKLVNLSKV